MQNGSENGPGEPMWIHPFCKLFNDLFAHTSSFYPRKTCKCQKLRFPAFFKKLKECIHTCTFYLSKTCKCAMTVFTLLKKKLNVKNLKLRTLQGMILEQLLHRLAPFWSPFGSIWLVLFLFWLHFEFFTVPFRSLWLAFGSQISERTFWNTFSKAPWENTRHPDLRTPPSLWARSGTLPQANSIRSGPEGAQGVLGCAELSLSFSFSSVSLSSIFDLIVSAGPFGTLPRLALSLVFLSLFAFVFLSVSTFPSSFLDNLFDDFPCFAYPFSECATF